jgi:hypothetical protein
MTPRKSKIVTTFSLPEEFRDLEKFDRWALPTMAERFDKSLAGSYEEAHEFYLAVFPRLEEIITYLNQYALDELPEDARNLANIALCIPHVSFPVELFHQMDVPNAVPRSRMPFWQAVSDG